MKKLEELAKKTILSLKQLVQIEALIAKNKHYPLSTIREEIAWFCTEIGLPDYYFKTTPLITISDHIEAVKAAKIMASVQKGKNLEINLARELENEAIYLVDDNHYKALKVEKRIEKKYPNCRLQSYRTKGKVLGVDHLRIYLVYMPKFEMKESMKCEYDLKKVSCPEFMKTSTSETQKRYQDILKRSVGWETPLIKISHKKQTNEIRLMVGTNMTKGSRFFSNVSDVIHSHSLVSTRKYAEQFSNGKTVYAFYLDDITDEDFIRHLVEDISLIYAIPQSPLSELFREGKLTAQETVFGVATWSFVHQFLSAYNEEYLRLAKELKSSPELLGILRTLRTRLVKDTYDESRVWDALLQNHAYLKKLFLFFDKKFNVHSNGHDIEKDLHKFEEEIDQNISVGIDRDVMKTVILFIRSVLRTNFYKKEKNSLAFLYDPSFLNKTDYPEKPFGVFHVIGNEFRGFHIRFRDIARGGIRLVLSDNLQNYLNNSDFIFDENYNLALTQQRKNKDIAEGGAKGTILLHWGFQDQPEIAFKKYISGLLDLMIPDESMIDYYGQEVILFLGPDEGTADLMAWASRRAKAVGYSYWQSFSTGKPAHMGGIPHDLYGMTTQGVHQYVKNTLRKLNLKEKNITKVMTGGPDGDLGSNEILISRDTIKAIIDGSGVLYDPKGIDRKELIRLAKNRKPISFFSKDRLSEAGFLVEISDRNMFLPDGSKIRNGIEFRNAFHFDPRFSADLFVPCGGRPASINIDNWTQCLDRKGAPRFKIIIEGANLFITQEARLRFEEKSVIIYKDSSANKGGVTSSSMEVFASLALSDQEYESLMTVKNKKVPAFRKTYIQEIIEIIKLNVSLEFEIIWMENQEKGTPRSVLTEVLSRKINEVADAVYASDLFKNKRLFKKVIECCCPRTLIDTIGFAAILKRIPDPYLKAVFASRLASRYVYTFGIEADEINFYEYIQSYK